MGSNFDPNDIHGFLREYRTPSYGYGQPQYFEYDQEPRWAPRVTGSDLLGDGDDDDSRYDDRQSEYTTTRSVMSRASTMRSAAPSSVFSGRVDSCRSLGPPSEPSLGAPPRMSFVQQFHDPGVPAPSHPGQILWCEFSELKNCFATFSLADEAGWINHHVRHLRDRYPQQLMCWFCDHVPFVASHPRDGFANFEERMQHVRGHILSDHRWTSEHMRPDFHVVRHLYDSGLLSRERYEQAMAFDETPPAYRLPGPQSSPSHRPLSQQQTDLLDEREYYHELQRQKRAERRRQREQEAVRRRR